MKHLIFYLIIFLSISFSGLSQSNIIFSDSLKTITLLKNRTYEKKEFTKDSLLIYKGTLSSINPEVRHGKFYFYNNKGNVIVTGIYNQDVPYGIWVYYNESYDTIKAVNYSNVWNYLENNVMDYVIDSTVLISFKKKDKVKMNVDGTFSLVEKMPSFNGMNPSVEFNNYIYGNLIYPIYAARKRIGGDVNFQFVVDSEGKIRNPIITNPIITNSVISDLKIEVIRILSESPLWEPGYLNNSPINVKYDWIISFLDAGIYSIKPSILVKEGKTEIEDEQVFYIVEDMPTFNGGDPATEFRKYIFQNLRYPADAALNGISGRVIIQFIVNPEGKLINPDVVVSAGSILDQEAIRLINSSPPWKPGCKAGKPVNVIYTFPLNFVLQ